MAGHGTVYLDRHPGGFLRVDNLSRLPRSYRAHLLDPGDPHPDNHRNAQQDRGIDSKSALRGPGDHRGLDMVEKSRLLDGVLLPSPAEYRSGNVTNGSSASLSHSGLWMENSEAVSPPQAEQLYREHYRPIVSLLARVTGDRGLAEELASDVLCRVLKRPHLFATGEHPEAWIYRTAMNLALDHIKMRSRRLRHERDAVAEAERIAARTTPHDSYVRHERQKQVRTVLAMLKTRDAQLLMLRHMDCSYQEIAHKMGIAAESVGALLARAIARFEKQYAKAYGGKG
jgi:RNA polymerase sigma-70 factor (ECF subfamily)